MNSAAMQVIDEWWWPG